jgi:hypothetical protein
VRTREAGFPVLAAALMIYDHSLADLDIGGSGIRARYLEY